MNINEYKGKTLIYEKKDEEIAGQLLNSET